MPGPELDQRALGERLEPLDAQAEQPGRRGHEPSPVAASDASSAATILGAVRVGRIGRGPFAAPGDAAFAARDAARSWRSTSSAWAAADVSAIRRDGPSPDAERPPVDLDLDPELLLVVGPDRLDQPVDAAARPVVRWVCSWSRLLGLLSVVIAWSADSSSAASSWIQSRAASQPRSR